MINQIYGLISNNGEGIVSKNNFKLRGRVFNGKYRSATSYLKGESEEVIEIVTALSNMYSNCGDYFSGDIGTIRYAMEKYLIGERNHMEGL